MSYKVFISHSTRDQWLVMTLANILSKFGIQISVAEWYLAPGQNLSKKVFTQIENSNCVVALLTRNGIRSNWVQQEIGFALKTKRPVIPLVEKGLDTKELGALQGREYIEYDPSYPKEALVKTSTYVKSLKLKKEEEEKTLLIAGGIIAFLLLIFGGGKK
ncbi:toll/interleukin-1 receptor domain-containing protein [candidate division WOR-3 bacterium]|nr:toll/interleukin-1 receptor domain-containing protein [candidate division WOR-3 bacterium]